MSASRCPICGGRGFVLASYYNSVQTKTWTASDTSTTTCRACNGRGVVFP